LIGICGRSFANFVSVMPAQAGIRYPPAFTESPLPRG
jgi:hypothetical protein